MKILVPVLFAIGTACCWGLYGPTLQFARSTAKPPEWSPFKPYVFIGVAYLVWAIGGGLLGMRTRADSFDFFGSERPAMTWGFIAGTLGALGAFSLTNAMLSGGKPLFVMPIVFGGAVTITAIASTLQLKERLSPALWIGMLMVVVGIVLVAANTPHGGPGHSKSDHVPAGSTPSTSPDPAADEGTPE